MSTSSFRLATSSSSSNGSTVFEEPKVMNGAIQSAPGDILAESLHSDSRFCAVFNDLRLSQSAEAEFRNLTSRSRLLTANHARSNGTSVHDRGSAFSRPALKGSTTGDGYYGPGSHEVHPAEIRNMTEKYSMTRGIFSDWGAKSKYLWFIIMMSCLETIPEPVATLTDDPQSVITMAMFGHVYGRGHFPKKWGFVGTFPYPAWLTQKSGIVEDTISPEYTTWVREYCYQVCLSDQIQILEARLKKNPEPAKKITINNSIETLERRQRGQMSMKYRDDLVQTYLDGFFEYSSECRKLAHGRSQNEGAAQTERAAMESQRVVIAKAELAKMETQTEQTRQQVGRATKSAKSVEQRRRSL